MELIQIYKNENINKTIIEINEINFITLFFIICLTLALFNYF